MIKINLTVPPTLFTGSSLRSSITLGANANGSRDSIWCLLSRTICTLSGLLKHNWQEQDSLQYIPAAKQSQYLRINKSKFTIMKYKQNGRKRKKRNEKQMAPTVSGILFLYICSNVLNHRYCCWLSFSSWINIVIHLAA